MIKMITLNSFYVSDNIILLILSKKEKTHATHRCIPRNDDVIFYFEIRVNQAANGCFFYKPIIYNIKQYTQEKRCNRYDNKRILKMALLTHWLCGNRENSYYVVYDDIFGFIILYDRSDTYYNATHFINKVTSNETDYPKSLMNTYTEGYLDVSGASTPAANGNYIRAASFATFLKKIGYDMDRFRLFVKRVDEHFRITDRKESFHYSINPSVYKDLYPPK